MSLPTSAVYHLTRLLAYRFKFGAYKYNDSLTEAWSLPYALEQLPLLALHLPVSLFSFFLRLSDVLVFLWDLNEAYVLGQ